MNQNTNQPAIARIWRGRTRCKRADEYEAYNYEVGVKPLIEKAMGVQCLREDRAGEPVHSITGSHTGHSQLNCNQLAMRPTDQYVTRLAAVQTGENRFWQMRLLSTFGKAHNVRRSLAHLINLLDSNGTTSTCTAIARDRPFLSERIRRIAVSTATKVPNG